MKGRVFRACCDAMFPDSPEQVQLIILVRKVGKTLTIESIEKVSGGSEDLAASLPGAHLDLDETDSRVFAGNGKGEIATLCNLRELLSKQP